MRVTHFAFDFSLRHQCSYRVDDNDSDRTGSHEHIGNFQCLLARIRLRYQQAIKINSKLFSIQWIKRMFGIYKCTGLSKFLCLCDNLQTQSGLTGTFWTVNLNYTPLGYSTNTKCNIKSERAS